MVHSVNQQNAVAQKTYQSEPNNRQIMAIRARIPLQQTLLALILCILASAVIARSDQPANFKTENDQPWVVMVTQPDCSFCERLEREILQPLRASGQFAGLVQFAEVNIGVNPTIIDFNGASITSVDFARRYQAFGTPTLLFLSASGEELSPPRYGIPDAMDFYAYTIEQTITAILPTTTTQ